MFENAYHIPFGVCMFVIERCAYCIASRLV